MEMKVEMEKKTYGGYPATQYQVVVAVYPGGRIPVVTMDFRYAEGSVRADEARSRAELMRAGPQPPGGSRPSWVERTAWP